MKNTQPIEIRNLLGGINQDNAGSAIADNEVSMAVNFRPRGTRVGTRGGVRRIFSNTAPNGASETILGLKVARRNTLRGLVTLGQTYAHWHSMPLNYQAKALLGTVGPSHDTLPWSIAAWNDAIFAARPADGLRLIQLSPDFVGAAGVPVPAAALTAVDQAAGILTAGTYRYVYAYMDSRLGSRGSYSPEVAVTTGASRQNRITGFVPPSDSRFDRYVLYRSLPNAPLGGPYLLITDELPISTTQYDDNIPISQQGELASSINTQPVADAASVVVFQGRVWIHDGRLLYPTPALNPEAFPVTGALEVGQDDNEDIVEILATRYRLIVAKRRSMWAVTGTGATSWDIRPFDQSHGCVAARALTEQDGVIVWQSDNDFYSSDGVSPGVPLSGIGRRKLRPFFEQRQPTTSSIVIGMPQTDGVLLGMRSSMVIREL